MSVAYNPLSGSFETKEPGPQGPAGTVSAAGDGSQATPSISFASDTNTGLFKHAADSIGVSTGGTTRIVIDSTGVVSIKKPGSANQANLAITAGGAGDPATQDPRIQFGASGFESLGTTEIRSTGGFNSRALAFYTGSNANGSEKMRLTSAGRLGIGTSSPAQKLSIEGGHLQITNTTESYLYFTNSPTANRRSYIAAIEGTGNSNSLTFATNADGADGVEKMRLTSAGRLGLGTASPGTKLDIKSDNNTSLAPVLKVTSNNVAVNTSLAYDGLIGSGELTIGNTAAVPLKFNTNSTERMRLTSDGRLGIGFSSPEVTLHTKESVLVSNTTAGDGNGRIQIRSGGTAVDTSTHQIRCGGGTGQSLLIENQTNSAGSLILANNHANGIITFKTSGDEQARLDSDGRLGLGTSSPTSLLHVKSNSGGGIVRVESASTSTAIVFNDSGTGGNFPKIGSSGNNLVLRGGAINDAAVIDPAGRFGLGTASPNSNLHISGGSDTSLRLTSSSAGVSRIIFGDTSDSARCAIQVDSSNSDLVFQGYNMSEGMRLDSSGRLLVGSSNAAATDSDSKLQVISTGNPKLVLARNDTSVSSGQSVGNIIWYGNDSDGTFQQCASINAVADAHHATGHKPTRLTFATTANNASSPTERMQLDASGSLKLGGTLPSAPNISLNANGSASFAGNVVFNGTTAYGHNSTTISGSSGQVFINSAAGDTVIGVQANGNGSPSNNTVTIKGNGDATFAGNLFIGGDFDTVNQSGVLVGSGGKVSCSRSGGTSEIWRGREAGSLTATSTIRANGSATFAGRVDSINASAPTQFMIGTNASSSSARAQFGYAVGTNNFLNGASAGDVCITFPSTLRFGLGSASSTINFGTNGSASFAGQGTFGINGSQEARVGEGSFGLRLINSSGVAKASIAYDGSATFAGTVQAGGNPGGGAAAGSRIRHEGLVEAARSGTQDLWKGFVVGSSTPTSRIKSDGSAEFAGDVEVGTASVESGNGVLLNANGRVFVRKQSGTAFQVVSGTGAQQSTKIQLNGDGSASFAANLGVTGSLFCRSTFKVFDGNAVAPNCTIFTNGSASFAGAVTAQGTTLTSDQRFKKNLSDAKSQLADVTALGNQLRNWDWTDDAPVADKDTRFLGLVAQDVETVCPGLVTTIARTKQGAELTPETTDEEGNVVPATYEQLDDSYKGIKHDVLVMKLLGAVAELSAKVAALESA